MALAAPSPGTSSHLQDFPCSAGFASPARALGMGLVICYLGISFTPTLWTARFRILYRLGPQTDSGVDYVVGGWAWKRESVAQVIRTLLSGFG